MREKILIVDDIELNREMLAVALGDTFPVIEAGDGDKAIEELKKSSNEIAAVLLDLVMPKVDGYEVLKFMKDEGLIKIIPVLVITADSTTAVERECLELGVSDFIRKPFDNFTVRKRVQNVVDLFMYKDNLENRVKIQAENLKRQNKLLEQQAAKLKDSN